MPAKKRTLPTASGAHYTLPDGSKLMRVTSAIGNAVPKQDVLVPWAGNCVARAAIEEAPKLARMRGVEARQEMYEHLRRAHRWENEKSIDLGNVIHDSLEAIVLGTPAPAVQDDAMSSVAAGIRFHNEWVRRVEATEMFVANPADGWCGRLDMIAELHDDPADTFSLVDYKTGKGHYPETAMQLAAYSRATVAWLKDGTVVDMPPIRRAVVVHLRPRDRPGGYETGPGYRVIPYDTSDAVYATFLTALDWSKRWGLADQKQLMGEPMTLPTIPEEQP